MSSGLRRHIMTGTAIGAVSILVLGACGFGGSTPDAHPPPATQTESPSPIPEPSASEEPAQTWSDVDPRDFPEMIDEAGDAIAETGVFQVDNPDADRPSICVMGPSSVDCWVASGGWERCDRHGLTSLIRITGEDQAGGIPVTCLDGAPEAIAEPYELRDHEHATWDDVRCSLSGEELRCERVSGEDFFTLNSGRLDATNLQTVQLEAVEGFPDHLQGTWTSLDVSATFSLNAIQDMHPGMWLDAASEDWPVPGATMYTICLGKDFDEGCSVAASMYLTYFPAGVGWDCVQDGAEGYGFEACDPDYTREHDLTEARLVIPPNHQHDEDYADSPPLYRH